MATSFTSAFHTSNFKSLVREKDALHASGVPRNNVGFFRKKVVCKESRIGKQPIALPSNVSITLEGQGLKVIGPLGELSITYPREVKVEEESGSLCVRKALDTRKAYQMHGLFRTLTDNMVIGVSKGFEKKLQLVGVGYRAAVEGNDLVLNLGFSHPVRMPIPKEMKVKVEESTRITISGYDKCAIGDYAAAIRRWRPPEPYKGKGIRYADEVVRLKAGKAGKKK
ncbi:60S ribosomal protein L6 [Dionaea muscipula]